MVHYKRSVSATIMRRFLYWSLLTVATLYTVSQKHTRHLIFITTLPIHRVRKKRGHAIFNYNSRISWSIFIIFVPLETGMNTLQQYVIYLLKCSMTS